MVCFYGFGRTSLRLQTESLKTLHFNLQSSKSDFFKVDYYRFKELFKLDETWYGVTPVYVESETARIFAIACLGKKLVFHMEICEFRE